MKKGITYDEVKKRLASCSLKITQQRLVVYQLLHDTSVHPTAEYVYEEVRKSNPSISKGTVYKILDTFVTVKLVKKVASEDGTMRFDAKLESHNHIICSNTNEILDFEDEELNLLIRNFLEEKNIANFQLKDFQVQLYGEKIDPKKKVTIQ